MYSFGNITSARGLPKQEREALGKLLEVYGKHVGSNSTRLSYYDGRAAVKNLGLTIPHAFDDLELSCPWPAKAVDAVANRCRFDGLSCADPDAQDELARICADNDLQAKVDRAVIPELVHGVNFATLTPSDRVGVSIKFHTALTAAATWDGEADRISAGFAVIDSKSHNEDGGYTPSHVNLYTETDTWELTRAGRTSGWSAARHPHPMGRPLMEPFVHGATDLQPFGRSRITRPVMSLTDSYLREMLRLEIGAEMFTSPQKVIIGADDSEFSGEYGRFMAYVTNLMTITAQDGGDVSDVRLEQFAASSMQPHLDVMRQLGSMFAMSTNVPLSELGIVQDNPSSAEAMYAAKEALVVEANDLNRSNASSLRNVALMALAIRRNTTPERLTPDERDIRANFLDPATPSIVSLADAMTKVASADGGFGGTSVFYSKMGFTQSEYERVQSDKRRNRGYAAVADMLERAGDGAA